MTIASFLLILNSLLTLFLREAIERKKTSAFDYSWMSEGEKV